MSDSNTTSVDSRGFTGVISPELKRQRERLRQPIQAHYPHVSDADLDAALLDYQRETHSTESDEELLAEIKKRRGLT